jgi:outer membrane protein OmpA-like peptidoglycan-associated protein
LALSACAAFAQDPPAPELAPAPEPVLAPEPPPADPAPKPEIVTEEIRTLLAVVNFEDGSAAPTPFSAAALDSVAALIRRGKNRRYEVHGFSCPDAGGQSRTMRSSAERVEAMVNYLSANGVPASGISTIIRGSERAEAKNAAAESCTRVEIVSIKTLQREVIPEPKPEPITMAEFRPEPKPEPEPEPKLTPTPADEQGRPTIAVYMAGEEPAAVKGAHYILGGELARTISESDKYLAVDRTEDILNQIAKEHIYQRGGAVDDEQIKALGQQLGAQYLCISNIKDVGKRSYYLDVRLVDVVTAEIKRTVTANSNLKDANEKTRVARDIAYELIETDKARAARKRKKAIFLSTAIGLDVLGAGAVAYGYFENSNVVNEIKKERGGAEADRAATRRNAAYIVGGALLVSGVSIHIVF